MYSSGTVSYSTCTQFRRGRAQNYGEQGDVVDAAAQIQQLLKFSSNQELKDTARQYLARLESQQSAK